MGILSSFTQLIEGELERRLTSYQPSGGETLEKRMKEDGQGRKGLLFDPFTDTGYAGGLFRPKGAGGGLISNHILKMISRRDPIVSTILHVRANQAATFCRRQQNRFDVGFKMMPRDKGGPLNEDEILEIEDYLLNCGIKEGRSHEDKLTFDQFAYMLTWDWLVYGHAAIEKVHDRANRLYAFLPLPAETIYYANKKLINRDVVQNTIEAYRDAWGQTHGDKPEYEAPSDDPFEYLQVINGKVVEGFTRDELVFARIYMQTEVDLNGYAIGPLERALSMITAHLQIENHQKMFFTHGIASKGLLVIQGDVSPNQLRALQAQWTNQISGPQSAWRTPILAGINGVQWQPLTMANRDMEFAAYQDHVIRTIHASLAIDPEETGFGYLSKGVDQKSLSESSNEWKITSSRDRGLRPLLSRLEAIINEDVIPAWNEDYARKYKFCFVGLDAESREEEISRLQSEVQLHTTLDEARQSADLEPMQAGGGLILNPLLLQTIQANMTKGEFMEQFMKIAGASQRPDLQYIPDPYYFQWLQFQQSLFQQQAEADATMQKEPPEKPGQTPEDPKARRDQQNDEQHQSAMLNHEQEQANAQSRAMAVDQFIQANPDLFKSMLNNLKKSDVNLEHIEVMREGLEKDFERGANLLVKEILEAMQEEMGGDDASG